MQTASGFAQSRLTAADIVVAMRSRRRIQPPSKHDANEIARDSRCDSLRRERDSSRLSRAMRIVIIDAVAARWSGRLPQGRALVIGGSVGGLFAAHLLRGAGWDVAVFERASGDLGDRGTGIGTREELFAVMRRIGLAADASIGIDVDGPRRPRPDGHVIHELPVRAVTSAWSRIWRPLRQALAGRLLCRRQGAPPDRASGRRCRCRLRRWLARRGRSAGRRRRIAFHGSRAVSSRDSRHAMPVTWPGAAWSRRAHCRPIFTT